MRKIILECDICGARDKYELTPKMKVPEGWVIDKWIFCALCYCNIVDELEKLIIKLKKK